MNQWIKGISLLVAVGFVAILAVQFQTIVEPARSREIKAACKGLRPSPTSPVYQSLAVAKESLPKALEFTAQNHEGKSVKLSDYRGKVVVVNFWGSWCGVCESEKPSLEALQKKYDREDLVVLALASNSEWEPVRKKLPQGSPLTILLDPPKDASENLGAIAKSYGITAVPESFVVDRTGQLRYYFVNKRDWSTSIAETCIDDLVNS